MAEAEALGITKGPCLHCQSPFPVASSGQWKNVFRDSVLIGQVCSKKGRGDCRLQYGLCEPPKPSGRPKKDMAKVGREVAMAVRQDARPKPPIVLQIYQIKGIRSSPAPCMRMCFVLHPYVCCVTGTVQLIASGKPSTGTSSRHGRIFCPSHTRASSMRSTASSSSRRTKDPSTTPTSLRELFVVNFCKVVQRFPNQPQKTPMEVFCLGL